MKRTLGLISSLIKNEQGGEAVDYALVTGFIVVACLVIIGAVGTKCLGRWNSLNVSI